MNLKVSLLIGVITLIFGLFADDCPTFFHDGDTPGDCSVRECSNGGYLDPTEKFCICPSGYLGIHCEAVKTSMPPDNHFKAGGTSFNIMNINLYTQYWGVQTYKNIEKSLTRHFETYPNGYGNYNLMQTTGNQYLDGTTDNPVYDYTFKLDNVQEKDFILDSYTDTGLYLCYEMPIYEYLITMIQTAGLKNTVITIITQHPPLSNLHDEAREIAVAFGIRINVLWIKDDTFNRCADQQISDFKTFVDITGGLFVQLKSEENDQSTINLVSQVLLTHYKPQYVSIQSFPDCSTVQNVPVVIDPVVSGPYNFVFLGNNANPTPQSFRDCQLQQPPLRSVDNKLAIFQSPDPTCTSLSIKATSGSCTAIVFTNANSAGGPLDLSISTTYAEDQTIDASRYAIIETVPFYPAFHVESNPASLINLTSISASYDSSWNPVIVKRDPAAFEWIPSKPITCDASQTYSLFLKISVGTTFVQRAVRVACVPKPIVTTVSPSTPVVTTEGPSTSSGPSTSTEPSTSAAPTTSAASTTTGVITSTVGSSSTTEKICIPDKNYATFLFAYPTDFNPTTYGLVYKTIGSAVTANFPDKQTLANTRFDMNTPSDDMNYVNSPYTFTTNCIVYQPNETLSANELQPSDALKTIQNFLENPDEKIRKEGSMIVLLLNRFPKNDDDLDVDQYDKLTNLNIKVFPIITIANLNLHAGYPGRSGAVFNRIAAQTNGHYIVADDTIGKDVNSDINKIVSNLMQTGYNQNLLFTRNVGANRMGTNLGTVRIPLSPTGESTIPVTITVSLSAVDGHIPIPPSRLLLGIKPNGGAPSVSIDFLTQATGYTNSNYYTTTVNLPAGIERELFLLYVLGSDQNDLLIRMWTPNNIYREASYMKVDGKTPLPTVDENSGAALRFTFDNKCTSDKKGTLLITDCNGVVSAKYDSDQIFNWDNASSTFYQFVPFFCDTQPTPATCISGAESKYDAQFVSDTFSITQSFQCRPGSGPIDNCKLKDGNGNYQCSGTSPFMRGPTGSLTDCSNHGHLSYNEATKSFNCDCDLGFDGPSCEVVTCSDSDKNLDPLAIDNSYHTYTVVVGLETDNGFLALDDAQKLFGLNNSEVKLPSIWKYQLITICSDGIFDMIYSGSDLEEFRSLFKYPNYLNRARICNTDSKAGSNDLTTIYKQAVKGIGRNVKGIIVYYSEVSSMINVTLDDFIVASQPYQQQMFVYAIDDGNVTTLSIGDSIAQAAMSTGGFLIQSYVTSDDPTPYIDATFIPDLLQSSSSIAWYSFAQAGDFSVSTKDNTISYLITWKAGTNIKTLNPGIASFRACIIGDDTYASCKFQGSQKVNGSIEHNTAYYVAVYSLNDDIAPKAQIISDLGKDSSDAVSTSTSNGRTMLTFNVPPGYTVVPNDGDEGVTRNAERNLCTFDWTAYSVFTTEKYATGANIAKVTIQMEHDPSKSYTRFFPFGTSSALACQNGGTFVSSTGSCSCPPGFQGPDCSLVKCTEFSTSNAWSDVCVCKAIDDVDCATQYTSAF